MKLDIVFARLDLLRLMVFASSQAVHLAISLKMVNAQVVQWLAQHALRKMFVQVVKTPELH